MESKIIGIDFDGTCATHDFPNIGQSIGAEEVLIDRNHSAIYILPTEFSTSIFVPQKRHGKKQQIPVPSLNPSRGIRTY